ncbi:hypothetical protein F5Y08DRAFT_340105 [Xylaria arbuscula]|nr:hypothetical protein F5Y08DRAFT_340105 [Xylaria arbuscula]
MAAYYTILIALETTFEDRVSEGDAAAVCNIFMELGTNCIHPITKRPYVEVLGAGRYSGPGTREHGFDRCVMFKFDSDEDKIYFLREDPTFLEAINTVYTMQKVKEFGEINIWRVLDA